MQQAVSYVRNWKNAIKSSAPPFQQVSGKQLSVKMVRVISPENGTAVHRRDPFMS